MYTHYVEIGLMQEALLANPYETLNVATAIDRALKVFIETAHTHTYILRIRHMNIMSDITFKKNSSRCRLMSAS